MSPESAAHRAREFSIPIEEELPRNPPSSTFTASDGLFSLMYVSERLIIMPVSEGLALRAFSISSLAPAVSPLTRSSVPFL